MPTNPEFIRSAMQPDHWANLLWALGSADISHACGLPWLPPARRQALAEYFAGPGVRASLEPALIQQLDALTSRRLGIYFEHLWAFAFSRHPDYQLLHHNLALRAEGRTLGELDFVVQYLPDDITEHWEVAVKFYLQVADAWVGPGLKDRLDIKLARTRDHQLPVVHQPQAQALLAAQGVSIERQWTLMPGRRFVALGDASPASPFWWATWDDFLHGFSVCDWRWAILPKPCWLASLSSRGTHTPDPDVPEGSEQAAARIPSSTETTAHSPLTARGPVCVAATDASGEHSRGFIVPDDWYSRALHTLAHSGAHTP